MVIIVIIMVVITVIVVIITVIKVSMAIISVIIVIINCKQKITIFSVQLPTAITWELFVRIT